MVITGTGWCIQTGILINNKQGEIEFATSTQVIQMYILTVSGRC